MCVVLAALATIAFIHFSHFHSSHYRDVRAEQEAKCKAMGMVLLTGRDVHPVCVDGVYP